MVNPSYGHIIKKINKFNIDIKRDKIDNDNDDDHPIIAIDSTDIKITNRDQWMNKKWNVQNRHERKSYIKIHIAIDMKTRNPCFRNDL